jgi:ATP-dependent DNA helicase PIF1
MNGAFSLKLPLAFVRKPSAMCDIKNKSGIAAMLRKTSIIIWDECTMSHKHSLEAFYKTMQDINGNNPLFGGAVLQLSADFRQTYLSFLAPLMLG